MHDGIERPQDAHRRADARTAPVLPWIEVAPRAPYFITADGRPWHPVGQNDAISWVEFAGLFRRKDLPAVDAHLARLAAQGVTVLRLMLEYAQVRHRYIERPVGTFVPAMVQLWDDLFALCEAHGLRILLTPFDTFWMWLHFRHHPYARANGGPLDHPSRALLCRASRDAMKARLSFAARRWGGSGALFAWDLWNEIHPAQAEMSAEPFAGFIEELSAHLRGEELRLYGRAHPQTVSLFGPELRWRPEMAMEEPIFRHPSLDFANLHIYEHGTIDDPANTVDAAIGMGRIVGACLAEIRDGRPFFDSEHGPIHRYKDRHLTLPADFDDEYFRHMQWAHLAAGGAGGGMRWPNRSPHVLTPGMREAQRGLADFLPLIDWPRFDRGNVTDRLSVRDGTGPVPPKRLARFGCASRDQALVYLLRRDTLDRRGMLRRDVSALALEIAVPGLEPGRYRVTGWDTRDGRSVGTTLASIGHDGLVGVPAFATDLAIALVREAR